jgi:hypothetical protein
MLHQTFIHIPGIGKHTEQELWEWDPELGRRGPI